MRQRGFTVIEFVLIVVALAILTGVGYVVVQKRGGLTAKKYSTNPETIERLRNEDSYYQTEVHTLSSPEETKRSADSTPNFRKVEDEKKLCGAGNYQVLDDNGNVVSCVHGGE